MRKEVDTGEMFLYPYPAFVCNILMSCCDDDELESHVSERLCIARMVKVIRDGRGTKIALTDAFTSTRYGNRFEDTIRFVKGSHFVESVFEISPEWVLGADECYFAQSRISIRNTFQ